jgi:ribosomal protein S18 acetylase RimI-like enzyme
MSNSEAIIPVTPAQKAEAGAIIVKAFQNDPIGSYITPDATKLTYFLSWFGNTALTLGGKFGQVYTTPSTSGVAVWFPPGHTELSLWGLLSNGIIPPFKVGLTALRRFLTLMDFASQVHRTYVPQKHWYLLVLVVDPASQGQGMGGRLIQPILTKADAEGLPCYLETTNPQAVPFYEKYGFKTIYHGRIPGSNVSFWGIKREPR